MNKLDLEDLFGSCDFCMGLFFVPNKTHLLWLSGTKSREASWVPESSPVNLYNYVGGTKNQRGLGTAQLGCLSSPANPTYTEKTPI